MRIKNSSFIGTIVAITLAGCGGGGAPSAIGYWTRASIGIIGYPVITTQPCPSEITLAGAVASCSSLDHLQLNADGSFEIDLYGEPDLDPLSPLKLPTKTWGIYSIADGIITTSISRQGVDRNLDGVFDTSEIASPQEGSVIEMKIIESTKINLFIELNVNSSRYTSYYSR